MAETTDTVPVGAEQPRRQMTCLRCGGQCARMNNRQKYCLDCGPAITREANAANYRANRVAHAANGKAWREANRERLAVTQREWARANREKVSRNRLKWQARNPEKARALCRRWYEINNERARASARRRMAERLRNSPVARLQAYVGNSIGRCLRGSKAGRPWESLVGYTVAELREHLERQFTKGMTWANYGEWHVDHVIPKASFRFESADGPEFRACWALTNLRPLWALDNLSKRDRRTLLI